MQALVRSVFILAAYIHLSCQLERKFRENDTCLTTDGKQGICKKLDNCSLALSSIKSGYRPKTCEFVENQVVVCCPSDNQTSTQATERIIEKEATTKAPVVHTPVKSQRTPAEIAKQKCREYGETVILEVETPVLSEGSEGIEQIDTCRRVEEPLVVGGQNAKSREFPHMALIGYGEKDITWLCGGSLISTRFVLSAAHCSRPASLGVATWAKLGELDTSTDYDDADPITFRIIQRYVHPNYKRNALYNDIALFQLDQEVDISEYMRPLCLFTEDKIPQKKLIATGWGHTSWENKKVELLNAKSNSSERNVEQGGVDWDQNLSTLLDIRLTEPGGSPSAHLMKVNLSLVATETCDERYKESRGQSLSNGILGESQLCAGDEVGKDTCQGDSGGPLQIPLKEPYCMYGLVGVTSFGKPCGNGFPGVYTKVSQFLPWIVKKVWPE